MAEDSAPDQDAPEGGQLASVAPQQGEATDSGYLREDILQHDNLPQDLTVAEAQVKKVKYPWHVLFIMGNGCCEMFSYYGMRTVLTLYLNRFLLYSEDVSTVIFHVFVLLCYSSALIGGIIADSWLGKYKTVIYLSIFYAFGNIVLSISSVPTFNIPKAEVAFLGLALIALGSGGIKPCVSSFGGDQFVLPQQERQLASFFSLFYFGINIGSLVSTFITPELSAIPCLGSTTCYPLAFGVPAILMLASIVLFAAGKPLYTIKKPEGNVMVLVTKCMWSAMTNKLRGGQHKKQHHEIQLQEKQYQQEKQQQLEKQQPLEKQQQPREELQLHWLDYADARFAPELRDDIRYTLGVLLLFVPLPVFWALYDQHSSRWTFQANHMNGRLGSFIVKPDQMQVLSSVLVLVLLPLMEFVVYPALARCHLLHRPLQKMAVGGLLGAVALVISGVVELQLEAQPGFIVEPSAGLAQVHLLSGMPCDVTLSRQDAAAVSLRSLRAWDDLYVEASGRTTLSFRVSGDCAEGDLQFDVYEKQSNSFHLYEENIVPKLLGPYRDILTKNVNPSIRIMHRFDDSDDHQVRFTSIERERTTTVTIRGNDAMDLDSGSDLVEPGRYNVSLDGADFADVDLDIGGLYTVLLDDTRGFVKTTVEPNTVSTMWLVPQYVVMGFAEILLSITGLEFSFTQAPLSMKSFVSSVYQVTGAFGNLIIILIAEAKILPTQSDEFFLFAGIMTAAMLVFIWLATRFKYRDVSQSGG